jgi:PilZ domain-containing protein
MELAKPEPQSALSHFPGPHGRCYRDAAVTTVLICARPDLESDLSHTLFWRDDLERYVAERADEAKMLALATEPHVVVVERDLPGAEELVAALRSQSLPHPVSIVALSYAAAKEAPDDRLDAVLALPPGPEWDARLDQVLEVPTRKQERFEVHFDIQTELRRARPIVHKGLALNMSSGGILIECTGLGLYPGDDVALSLPIPGQSMAVEGRARVVRQPVEERLGLRFEAFAGNGDARVRDFLASLAAQHRG